MRILNIERDIGALRKLHKGSEVGSFRSGEFTHIRALVYGADAVFEATHIVEYRISKPAEPHSYVKLGARIE